MSHKADQSFFDKKRDWSRHKDIVLGHYLKPYLPKIATQNRPVLVVDGFAGPGVFKDGERGSPLIICDAIAHAQTTVPVASFQAMFVERSRSLAAQLRQSIVSFLTFAEVREADFASVVPELVALTRTHNIFLYLDPFTLSGLRWKELESLFTQINHNVSVEILLNFNVRALGRAACVALGKRFDTPEDEEDTGYSDESVSTKQTVDSVLGGDWWQSAFASANTFPAACHELSVGYLRRLQGHFAEVCHFEVKEKHAHAVPKFLLVFGSRHPDALRLMNDEVAKCLKRQAEAEQPREQTLFETRPESLVPPINHVRDALLHICVHRRTRRMVIDLVIRRLFGRYTRAEIRGEIEHMLKDGTLQSSTGKQKLNDEVEIWVSPTGWSHRTK